ncbi:hypothetical protein CRUP_005244 [Coryphaenoides rupestris]|nr:hypothetical protein CRUP_005244 [Coryphaenoides rupestris]
MVILKLSAVLLAYALLSIQKPLLHAAPPRAASETESDRASLFKHSTQKLLDAIVQEFMHTTSAEQAAHATKGNSVTAEKRACNTATCVTHRLADFLSRSGGTGNRNFVPTDVGAQAFGRRKRHNPL